MTTSLAFGGLESLKKSTGGITVKDVEDKIRAAVYLNHVRTDEYLKDFDRLRSGHITKMQFDRCLNSHYGIVISQDEKNLLMAKYGSDHKQPGMVNYREFCKTIDADVDMLSCSDMDQLSKFGKSNSFDPSLLDRPPTEQQIGILASTVKECRPLSPSSLSKCDEILARTAPYYQYHGINIKTCYEDFDRHNLGLVTESQFLRSFPGPPDVSPAEMSLLAKKYHHPFKHGLCKYIEFHQDVVRTQTAMKANASKYDKTLDQPDSQQHEKTSHSTLLEIFERIKIAVHKNGIRTTEFFKDHDKLRSGVITENQFVCGLSLCCSKQANLSRNDIQLIVNHYKQQDGRVYYKEFCDIMENAFNVPHLEKQPTTIVQPLPIGALSKSTNVLTLDEESAIAEILIRLSDIVQKRRLMLYPHFKDFDRGKCYTRGITKTQFARMLHMVSLDVPQRDLELICKKFEYPDSGDVNYPAFIQAIDSEYIGTAPISVNQETGNGGAVTDSPKKHYEETVDVGELMARICHHVMVNRIRVEEYFQDFDPLRHGSIWASKFRMGLSALGKQHLTEAQFRALVNLYADPKQEGFVLWTKFRADVEKVFTQRGLEKTPTYVIPPPETFTLSKPGTKNWDDAPVESRELFDQVMLKMQQKTNQRRVLIKPTFQDFDRHNMGHVTPSQFRQCVASLGLTSNEKEMDVVAEKFTDNTGFNYLRFLLELQPVEQEPQKYQQRLAELKLANRKEMPNPGFDDMDAIMNKIKTKIVMERIRVIEFMRDYDKLRTGRLLKTSFPRAIDLCSLGLTKKEVDILMEYYTSPQHPDYVDYKMFSDEVESVFTVKGLEKNPLQQVIQYQPPSENENNRLLPEAENTLENVMHRLADRVRLRRIQVFPLFEDYDRVHNGTVSRSQFHRVLSELEIGSMVSKREFEVLYQKFDVLIGGKHDFNYKAFCDVINDFANFEYGKP